ncbi:MAG TPA: multiubiquitin domain-containing protein [Nitrospiraceae bacterium]|nr:multiubiquitin domain-containing protein [Nitrospiraceae bacterium]
MARLPEMKGAKQMTENERRAKIRIHIDRDSYESPNPTEGRALYKLADIGQNRDLYRVGDGNHEDVEIPRDDTVIELVQGEHFYSQKEIKIVVNGEEKETSETRLSFDEVVAIAFPVPPTGDNIMFTITYRKGPNASPKGTLTEGNSVKVKKGMIFDVTATDRS